jgi:hypothetical protein
MSLSGDAMAQGQIYLLSSFFFFGATAPIWALAYLHDTFRFTSVY